MQNLKIGSKVYNIITGSKYVVYAADDKRIPLQNLETKVKISIRLDGRGSKSHKNPTFYLMSSVAYKVESIIPRTIVQLPKDGDLMLVKRHPEDSWSLRVATGNGDISGILCYPLDASSSGSGGTLWREYKEYDVCGT